MLPSRRASIRVSGVTLTHSTWSSPSENSFASPSTTALQRSTEYPPGFPSMPTNENGTADSRYPSLITRADLIPSMVLRLPASSRAVAQPAVSRRAAHALLAIRMRRPCWKAGRVAIGPSSNRHRHRSELVRNRVEERERPQQDLLLQDGQVAGAGRLSRRGPELVTRAHGGAEVPHLEIDAAAERVEVGLTERRGFGVPDRRERRVEPQMHGGPASDVRLASDRAVEHALRRVPDERRRRRRDGLVGVHQLIRCLSLVEIVLRDGVVIPEVGLELEDAVAVRRTD